MGQADTKVIQITNVAPQVTRDQLKILFGYLGEIDDIRLYPKVRHIGASEQLKICFVKFAKKSTATTAQYITSTVLFDRGKIPDEDFALAITKNGTVMPSLCSSERILPQHVVTTISDSNQMVVTFDPNLEANALPKYPPLPASYDSQKINEVRQTVQIEDVDSNICNEDYLEFFSQVAEVTYMCRCKSTSSLKNCMLVEFSDQPSIIKVLNGKEFKGNPIKIVHATQAIVKPDNEAMQKRIVEALSSSHDGRRSRSRSLKRRQRSRFTRRSSSRSHDRKRPHRRSRSRSRRRNSKNKRDMEVEEKRSSRKHRSRSRDRKRSRSRNIKERFSKRKHSRPTRKDRKRDKKHDKRR